ncbi:MAG: galactose-1-phosphate uridylyltransferase [Candidatus Schekmanbacteria bacterium]|nr:MAG: galactose-1-phosphate uridylyltransferase [Candidatus Schekmanbacteria bacterium]
MPEFRQNVATKDWVIIATERAKRPHDFTKKKELIEIPPFSKNCPFCPGNEEKTPPTLYEVKKGSQWQVRVIPNKFAALSKEGKFKRIGNFPFHSMTGIGVHEVVIETPIHNLSPALLPIDDFKTLLKVYRERYINIFSSRPRTELIIIFKNHGESAGTSLDHPHSQIVATPIIPLHIKYRVDEALRFFDSTGDCVFCYMMQRELESGERIVAKNESFVVFVPFAASSPFETWIMPLRHSACYGAINDNEIENLAEIFSSFLKKLYFGLDNPDYNYMIKSAPSDRRNNEHYHWYIKIIPRLTKTAGFEMGSGMYINSTIPEECAEHLRNVKIE